MENTQNEPKLEDDFFDEETVKPKEETEETSKKPEKVDMRKKENRPPKQNQPVKTEEPKKEQADKAVLFNTSGDPMLNSDYFFNGKVPEGFERSCGKPVDREDLLDVFNKVFSPSDNILFYKNVDKEVYLVIIPIKYSIIVGAFNNSVDGDFQKHAISFLNEGSVNDSTLRTKLEQIKKFVKYTDR